MTTPLVKLNNGMQIPAFGLGTCQSTLGRCESTVGEVVEVVQNAIEMGYRLFDCAWIYGNEQEIGEGLRSKIREGTVKREELFIVTKLWNTYHREEEEEIVQLCKESLKNFKLDYVDCYLMHWPCAQRLVKRMSPTMLPFTNVADEKYDITKTWKGMEECVKLGLVKSIGLSNFNSQQIKNILENCTIKPVLNQIEVTPFLNQKKLIKFCRDHFIEIMAYSPLGLPTRDYLKANNLVLALDDTRLKNIGNKYGKSGAQVILRYVYQQGAIPIQKSSNVDKIKTEYQYI